MLDDEWFPEEPVEIPINGELDLHAFNPGETGSLLPEYLQACLEKEIYTVRIIHGKGTGALREFVRAQLAKYPYVKDWRNANAHEGSWGATMVELQRTWPPDKG